MTVLCNLSINGYIFSLQIFIDSRANRFFFINQTIIIN
jgi:hypothetical protein